MQIQGGFNLGVFNNYSGNKVNNNTSIPNNLISFKADIFELINKYAKNENIPKIHTINFSNLSKRCDMQPHNREYTIASIPNDMSLKTVQGKNGECELPLPSNSSKHKTVVVLDSFFKPQDELSIGENKIAHGEMVSKIITNDLENKVAILGIDMFDKENSYINRNALNQALDDILEMKRQGVKIDGVNMSCCFEVTYKGLSKDLGRNINAKNIVDLKEEILNDCRESKIYRKYAETIDKINKLVDNGIDVYISAGNKNFAIECLSKAKIIGGKSAFGIKTLPSNEPKMPLITDYASDSCSLRLMQKDGKKGVGANNIFISDDELNSSPAPLRIEGTSFAAPSVLNQALRT